MSGWKTIVANQFKFAGTVDTPPPPPPPPGTGYPMPTIQDEKDTYALWGWSWNASQDPVNIPNPYGATPYTVVNPDVHGDTEGDDSWTYLQMSRRGPIASFYATRATEWLNYFRSGAYRTGSDSNDFTRTYPYDETGFGGDHSYGWGLLLDYEVNGTAASLTEAETYAAIIELLWSPSTPYSCIPATGCLQYSHRLIGRQLHFVARLYEITNALRGATGTNVARWLTLLNQIKNTLLNSVYWNNSLGMYFVGDFQTDLQIESGAYASGVRVVSGFQIGILTEGMFHAWRVTGDSALRTRLLQMANFVSAFGIDPEYGYTGDSFGIFEGKYFNFNTRREIINSRVAVRSDGADTRQVTIFGRDSSDAPISETITLNGTTDVLTSQTFRRYHRATVPTGSSFRTISFRKQTDGTPLLVDGGASNLTIGINAVQARSVTGWNPQYTVANVNLLVLGYKFTASEPYLTAAKLFFNNGTKGIYASLAHDVADNQVSHFVDTRFASSTGYFYLFDNKGELQYCYLIFENGGRPTIYSDTTAPTVAITAPSNGSTVSGSSVAVAATATDAVGVVGVQFKLDGSNLGAEDTSAPYAITWNSTTATNGAHSLTATARDAAGNSATSAPVSVTVNNVVGSSLLATLSASLSAGQWGELTGTNLSTISTQWTIGADVVMSYGDNAMWYPAAAKFYFLGGSHATGPNELFITYDDASNTWSHLALPFWACPPSNNTDCVHHAYCDRCIDPVHGQIYARNFSDTLIYRYDIATASWGSTQLTTIPYPVTAAMGLAWFQTLGTQGSLMVASGAAGGELYRWDRATSTWSDLTSLGPSGALPMGGYHNLAKYNPIRNNVLFGGGNASPILYEVSTTPAIVRKNDAPVTLDHPNGIAVLQVDPVNGKFLLFRPEGGSQYVLRRYDPAADTWTGQLSNPITAITGSTTYMVMAPISTYNGILAVINTIGQPARAFFYKGGA